MSDFKHPIPFHHFGGNGSIIHFAHANGYPPQAYQQFIQPFLKTHKVIASKFRPLWGDQQPESLKSWDELADDLIRFLDEQGLKNSIGIGHSLGGVTSIIAAIKRPDLFSKLILLDPVIFDNYLIRLSGLFPVSIRKKIIPIAKISAKRRDSWDSKEEVYQQWRSKKVFQKISDGVLKEFIEHAIVSDGNGKVTLAYSKEWETQVYSTAPFIFKQLLKLKTPMIVVKGANSDVITTQVWNDWQQGQPHNHFINFPDAGHLVPLEYPEELAKEILKIM
ncbi:MAG: pimeloyl-ACP methyl ester carboxylesterase [Saprospiraceae bacterium]|jgi:pimeloyl-ACP methyl ester carboxylesterase